MRIDGLPPAMGAALLQTVLGKKAPAPFGGDLTTPPAAAEASPMAVTTQATTSVQMLVALAAVDPAVERRRRQAVQADRGLSMLERLHADTVRGAVPPERLQELAAWAAAFDIPDDPDLAQIARDIELRVRVELAKHDLTA